VNGETVIITLIRTAHVSGASGIRLIITLDEKIELLSDKGIDHLVSFIYRKIAHFPPKNISSSSDPLFSAHTLIIGYVIILAGPSGNYEL